MATITFGEPVITERVPADKEPGLLDSFWGWVETKEDEALNWYSHTEASNTADAVLADVKEKNDALQKSAKDWMGYLGDPNKIQGTLNTVMIIVVVLGVVYVIANVAPLIRPLVSK